VSAGTSYSYRAQATDAASNLSGYSNTATASTPALPDTQAPTVPGNLTATAISSGQIDLSWVASSDDVGVTGYLLERCEGLGCGGYAPLATVSAGTTYSDTSVSAGTSYSYRAQATDAASNLSGYSNTATASTPAVGTGLAAAYGFDEGTGVTVLDASGNGNTGTVNGGATWVAGRYGNALSFNGTNARVFVNAASSLDLGGEMTLEAWVQPTASQSGWRTIVQREVDAYFLNGSHDGVALGPSGGGTLGGSTTFTGATSAMAIGAWTHLALTYDGSLLQLYVNGVPTASQSVSGAISSSGNPLWIGGNNPYGEYFNGLIDEVRVYNRALSQTEIQADMATPVSTP
jgi:Concanavalin A-like lectin/glucanases superfamily